MKEIFDLFQYYAGPIFFVLCALICLVTAKIYFQNIEIKNYKRQIDDFYIERNNLKKKIVDSINRIDTLIREKKELKKNQNANNSNTP